MNKLNIYDKILSPVVTEKSTSLSEQNKIVFKVRNDANKKNIKKNIEKLFKVNVIKVNIINKRSRKKITRVGKKNVSGYKKAIITLKKGQNIDLTSGL
tara:strand:+ start:788 stop:1081 length:294 start_codon:yes stop_codon:yes gene_type:complete